MAETARTVQARSALVKVPWERTARLATGLVLFAYAATHFLSHATGIFLLDTLEGLGRGVLLAPWRTGAGRYLLLACVLIHGGLGLRALARRRHLRMPAIEAWQLGLGLAIPLLLLPHVTDVRIGAALYGFEDSYSRILYLFWLVDPRHALPRQFLLMLLVWIHGSIGIHMWLRSRPWYPAWQRWLLVAAVLVPVLAVVGIMNAGWDEVFRALDPRFSARHGPPPPDTPDGANLARLGDIWLALALLYGAGVAVILSYRLWRDWWQRRGGAVTLRYAGHRTVRVPPGFSILEASRWSGIPHLSVCGGRGRCSTCRVRVLEGGEALPPPNAAEAATLASIGDPVAVRLACQVRPETDLTLVPLLGAMVIHKGFAIDLRGGRELMVTAMSIDLRESTRLSAERLPFDAIFIVDQYVRAVTAAVTGHGGFVTSVAGDGVMSVFGVVDSPEAGARNALRAAETIGRALARLGADLADELPGGLRYGIGIHSGPAVVGTVGPPGSSAIHFLGDTGNVAARLEALTKEAGCSAIVSAATVVLAGRRAVPWPRIEAPIRGREGSVSAYCVDAVDVEMAG